MMPEKTWKLLEPIEVPENLLDATGGSRLVAQVLRRRGIEGPGQALAFLDPAVYQPASPYELPGMVAAVDRLERAIKAGKSICVWGDFDVDGQTSTTILVGCLRDLGARVSYHIPVRGPESHGVGLEALERAIAGGAQVLLTCDTGISAVEAVETAHSHGLEVIITDHHALPERLPDAENIVNPRLLPDGHALSGLPGAGVAYELAQALYECFGKREEVEKNCDLAALGIVADLAELRGDTRYLAMRGLAALRENRRTGLQQVLQLAELDAGRITEEHIGFVLAPRLNALGRLADSNPAVELLTTGDPVRARILAQQLEALNARRKLLTDQVFQGALAQIERTPALLEHAALVLGHPGWPAGVVGIVASRLVERYGRPVILLVTPEGEVARGSARSVPGCDITRAIASQAALLTGYGGHPMAAGLSLDPANLAEFQRGLDREVAAMLESAPPAAGLEIEAELPLDELTLERVADFERLAPFGPGNPALVFAGRNLAVRTAAPVGRGGEHLLVTVESEGGKTARAIWWQGGGERLPEGRFDLAYSARTSNFRGKLEVQVEWIDAKAIAAFEVGGGTRPSVAVQSIDLRVHPQPVMEIKRHMEGESCVVWAENAEAGGLPGVTRLDLMRAETLVVWTAPASDGLLEDALRKVGPKTVVWVCRDPRESGALAFLNRLAGLIKYALKMYDGRLSVEKLAAVCGQRVDAVLAGLEVLAGQGWIGIVETSEAEWQVVEGGRFDVEVEKLGKARLTEILGESAAFRGFTRRAEVGQLVATGKGGGRRRG